MKVRHLLALFLIGMSSLVLAQPAPPAPPPAPPQPVPNGPASTQQAEDPAVPAMKTGKNQEGFLKRHQLLLDRAKQGNIDIMFIGDSITQGWESRGKNVWSSRFADKKAANFGISGDKTQHVLWRIENGELGGVNPKLVVLMIGTNNSRSDSAHDIARGVTACVNAIRERAPQSKIVLMAIFARGEKPDDPQRAKLKEVNDEIQKLADGQTIRWLDINDKLVEPDGTISKEMMPDFLHPTEKGYVIWADALEPVLAEWGK